VHPAGERTGEKRVIAGPADEREDKKRVIARPHGGREGEKRLIASPAGEREGEKRLIARSHDGREGEKRFSATPDGEREDPKSGQRDYERRAKGRESSQCPVQTAIAPGRCVLACVLAVMAGAANGRGEKNSKK
jgi:hypothetical protein